MSDNAKETVARVCNYSDMAHVFRMDSFLSLVDLVTHYNSQRVMDPLCGCRIAAEAGAVAGGPPRHRGPHHLYVAGGT